MKIFKLLSLLVFLVAIAMTSACGDGEKTGDNKNQDAPMDKIDVKEIEQGADLLCEMKEIQNELTTAFEEGDEAKIDEITKKLENKSLEMNEYSRKMAEKFKDDKNVEKQAKLKMFEILENCEYYTSSELDEIRQIQETE